MSDSLEPIILSRVRPVLRGLRAASRRTATGIRAGSVENLPAPCELLPAVPCLRLKPGWRLGTDMYVTDGGANGFTWAVPPGASWQPAVLTAWPRKVPSRLRPAMAAIDSDGSAWSYLCASLLARELAELGAWWHGCDWSMHELYGGGHLDSEWTWSTPRPKRFSPAVASRANGVSVSFYTRSDVLPQGIFLHTDTYVPRKGYEFASTLVTLAEGPGGIVF